MSRIFVAYKGTFLAFPTSNDEWITLTKLFEDFDISLSLEDMLEKINMIEELVNQYKDVKVQTSQEKIMNDITERTELSPVNILRIWVVYIYKLIKNDRIINDDDNGYFMSSIDNLGEESWHKLII
jgi:hypothetical protein